MRATTPPSGLVKRGYVPDGRGITYRDCFVEEGTSVVVDDDLVMHFTKQLHRSDDDPPRKCRNIPITLIDDGFWRTNVRKLVLRPGYINYHGTFSHPRLYNESTGKREGHIGPAEVAGFSLSWVSWY